MVDFLNNPIAEFNELRIATTNLVTTKAAEYSETVLTFVSNHSSELLYGSLGAFVVVTLIYLSDQWFEAVCERDEYKWSFERAERWENFWLKAYEEEREKVIDLEDAVGNFHDERRKMQDVINKLREECDAFEADLEEVRDERDDFESDRDRLLERIEILQEMTDTYKELVAEIETPQLRLAA